MLETIRQFAEDQLVARGDVAAARTAHARYFAGSEPQILALWDSPRQREAYTWITMELANLRTAFRWAADHDYLDEAAAIANLAGFVGTWIGNFGRQPGPRSSSSRLEGLTGHGSQVSIRSQRSATSLDGSRQASATSMKPSA